MLSFTLSGSYTDLYELSMGQAYFLEKQHTQPACFDYFFRKVPNGGGYVLFAGLEDLLTYLEDFCFTDEDLAFLKAKNFRPEFLDYLKEFRFRGSVYSVPEGELVFPGAPVLRIEGSMMEAQLVETALLNILNFESLIATKASRMRYVAGDRILSEFGLRRAQGPGGILATRASVIGGFQSTSSVYGARLYELQPSGTMAHSFVQSYEDELAAFRAFARARPQDCVFLVDTYDTLRSGVPNAITVAKEMEQAGNKALGIRLDSGDLAYFSKQARKMLDEAGLDYMKIVASNQLDEVVIRSLLNQEAPIDIFGVGTKLVTGDPDGALDGVYKLSMAAGKPRLKLSESKEKTTLPGIKQVYRLFTEDGKFFGADAVVLDEEGGRAEKMHHPSDPEKSLEIKGMRQEPLLKAVMKDGKRLAPAVDIRSSARYASERLALLPDEYKRFEFPHVYKVGLSHKLLELREELRNHYKKIRNESLAHR